MQLLIIGTNCRFFKRGRIVAWDELSLFGVWDELSLGTNRRLGRIVSLCKTANNCTLSGERDKTADFKRGKTADFQNRTKQPIFKIGQNSRFLKQDKTADFKTVQSPKE